MFSPQEIKKTVADHLDTDLTIPGHHRTAIVTFINNDKAEIAIANKLVDDHWDVELIANHTWTGDNEIGFISKITW